MTPMNKPICLHQSSCFRILAAGLILSVWSVSAPAQQNTSYSDPGMFPVSNMETMALKDNLRDKDVSVRVYYPEGNGPFPVLAFSHSVRGNKDMFSVISNHWASHGYVVVHPQHDDEGVQMTDAGMHPPEDKIRNRLRDIVSVFDSLDQIESKIPAIAGKLDQDRLAVAGHSYGSFISMISGGVSIDIGDTANANIGDARVRCIISISPSGPGDYGMSEASWQNLTTPALFFNGTDDLRAGRSDDWRMQPYQRSPNGDKYEVIIEGATHFSYGDDSDPVVPRFVKTASTAFWDACLHNADEGKRFLREDGFSNFAGDAATITYK
jgi:predicted dienelactone hydrolase